MRVEKFMFEDVIRLYFRVALIGRMEEDYRGVLVIREEGIGIFLFLR